MIRWRKVWIVATFEFLSTVRRPGYLIATFGMPLFMAAYAALVAVPASIAGGTSGGPAIHGIVDDAGVLRLSGDLPVASGLRIPETMRRVFDEAGQGAALAGALESTGMLFRPFATEDEARAALADRRIAGFFVLATDYPATGRVQMYSPDSLSVPGADARQALGDLIRQRLVAERLEGEIAARILDPIAGTDRFTVARSGEVGDGARASLMLRLAVPLLFMVLFLLSVLMTSGYLMQGTAIEKENKVVEVLLASADPDEILAGKLLGLGGAGLLQIALWLAMMLVFGLGIVPLLWPARVEVPWSALLIAVPFFIAAFLFFGGLILGTGSLGSNMREAQQLAMVWSLMAALPLLLLAVLVREPHGTVARVLTWIPFTSGPVVVLRASTDAALMPWWEIGGALGVLLVATWIALRLGARLFRIGLLSSGARPSLREIVRQARLSG